MVSLVRFLRYAAVGVVNTLVHWLLFVCLYQLGELSQASSNLLAFSGAATFSYLINAQYTFAVRPNGQRYVFFLVGMGCLSLAIGALSDHAQLSPWLTLVVFSLVSLLVGYAYSTAVVFKRRDL